MEKEQEAAEQQAAADELDAAVEQMAGEQDQSTTGAGQPADEEDLVLLLEDARSKADKHWDQLMRTRAEMDNLRKRQARELENAHKYALERFVSGLLPVKDSMEMGLSAAMEEGAGVEKLREGAELTLKLFADVLGKFQVEEVNPEGQPFDPELHQAMSTLPRDDVPPNTVVTVVQKGYTLNGRLVRPAMVMVSQAVAKSPE